METPQEEAWSPCQNYVGWDGFRVLLPDSRTTQFGSGGNTFAILCFFIQCNEGEWPSFLRTHLTLIDLMIMDKLKSVKDGRWYLGARGSWEPWKWSHSNNDTPPWPACNVYWSREDYQVYCISLSDLHPCHPIQVDITLDTNQEHISWNTNMGINSHAAYFPNMCVAKPTFFQNNRKHTFVNDGVYQISIIVLIWDCMPHCQLIALRV